MTTLEEIEAVHEARAARKAGRKPVSQQEADTGDDADAQIDDLLDPAPEDVTLDKDEEIAHLRQQLDAMQGRVAPSQRQADEYRRFYDDERRAREAETARHMQQIAELREQLDAKRAEVDVESLLTEEERDNLDPMQLEVFKKIAKAMVPKVDVRSEAERLFAEKESRRVNAYREDKLSDPRFGLSNLAYLAQDQAFLQWTNHEDNDDFDPLVRSLLSATTERDIDRYAKAVSKRIAKFNESRKSKAASRPTDANTSLNKAMQRRPPTYSNEEVGNKLAEATRLARSRDPADRKKAEAILNAL